jgi:hypothetical protein
MRYLSIIILTMTIYLAAGQFWLQGRPFSPLGETPAATHDSTLVHDLMREPAPDNVEGYRHVMATFQALRMENESSRTAAYAERRAWVHLLGMTEPPAANVEAAVKNAGSGTPSLDVLRQRVLAKSLSVAVDTQASPPGYMPEKDTMMQVAPGLWGSYLDRGGSKLYEYRMHVRVTNTGATPVRRIHLQLAIGDDPSQVLDCADADFYNPPVTESGGERFLWCKFDTSNVNKPPAVAPDDMRRLLEHGFSVLPESSIEFPTLGLQIPDQQFGPETVVLRNAPNVSTVHDDIRGAKTHIEAQGCSARNMCGEGVFPVRLVSIVTLAWYIAAIALLVLTLVAQRPPALVAVLLGLVVTLRLVPISFLWERGAFKDPSSIYATCYLVAGTIFAVVAWRLPLTNARTFAVATATSLSVVALGFLVLLALIVYGLTHFAG